MEEEKLISSISQHLWNTMSELPLHDANLKSTRLRLTTIANKADAISARNDEGRLPAAKEIRLHALAIERTLRLSLPDEQISWQLELLAFLRNLSSVILSKHMKEFQAAENPPRDASNKRVEDALGVIATNISIIYADESLTVIPSQQSREILSPEHPGSTWGIALCANAVKITSLTLNLHAWLCDNLPRGHNSIQCHTACVHIIEEMNALLASLITYKFED